jgi:hypothetical protein
MSQTDSLLQRLQRRKRESGGQFGLTGQDEREQPLGRRLHVAEEAHFFEQLHWQALRLVDDHDAVLTRRTLRQQRFPQLARKRVLFRATAASIPNGSPTI